VLTLPPDARRISSRSSAFYKSMLPVIWYGVMLLVTVVLWKAMQKDPRIGPWIFLLPACMAALFHFIARSLLADLVDEVWDNGSELIVVNEGHVEHLPLANIVNISYSGYTNPKRATLTLRQPGRWGRTFGFIPVRSSIRILSLGTNEMIDELIQRVDKTRG
jgi:hypothetical protein